MKYNGSRRVRSRSGREPDPRPGGCGDTFVGSLRRPAAVSLILLAALLLSATSCGDRQKSPRYTA